MVKRNVCLLLVFTLFVYQLFLSMFLQGLRRRYGDSSVQAEGAVQFLKDVIPMVINLLFFVCLFVCLVGWLVGWLFSLARLSVSLLV